MPSAEEIVLLVHAFLDEATALVVPDDAEGIARALTLLQDAALERVRSLDALRRGNATAAHTFEASSERLLLRARSLAQQVDDTLEPEPEI